MGAINLLMADPVASDVSARAQMGVFVLQAATTVMPTALGPTALAVPLYECRRYRNRLPTTAFCSHANGRQHVSCLACNVRSSHKALLLKLILS